MDSLSLSLRSLRVAAVVPLLLLLTPAAPAAATERIEVRAKLSFDAPEIVGESLILWRNDGRRPHARIRLLAFGNRFREPPSWNDLERHFLLSAPVYRPGATRILSVSEGGRPLRTVEGGSARHPPGTVVTVELGRSVAPGEEVRLTVRFETRLPTLADVYGMVRDGLWIADEGWAPRVLGAGGSAGAARPAPVSLRLTGPEGATILAGRHVGRDSLSSEVASGHVTLALSRAPFETIRLRSGARRLTVISAAPTELRHRVSRYAPPKEALLETLEALSRASSSRSDWTVFRFPLRWHATASTPELVIASDRLFEVHPVLRPFHQRELAYAVFLHEELDRALDREPPADARWVAEGLAWRRADAVYRERFRGGREVRDWIRLFDFFAIVDRFETAPRIPFLRAFFPTLAPDDTLALRIDDPAGSRPPGRLVFSKLEARLRADRFGPLVDRYERGDEPFRSVLRDAAGSDAEAFLDEWLRPVTETGYGLEDVLRNPDGRPGARFRIARRHGEPRRDSVEVALETEDGEHRLFADLDRAATPVDATTGSPVEAVRLDPDRKALETRLDDNRSPQGFHLLLDSADVEVSSTEFGFSTLLVARRRYDYRRDLAAAGFWTSRGVGANAGFQLHGGPPVDDNLFRRNLFAYYSFQDLDPDFRNERTPGLRTSGHLAGLGFRYNDYDTFWFENPSRSRHLRVFFDWYDRALGGDFDYVQTGASFAMTRPVRDDTVIAGQVLNGFSVSTGSGRIPNQGLFSLGGFRSIRGIAAEDDLAENLFLLRAEIRHMLPLRLDLDFEDVLIARRLQVKVFVDAGRVEDRRDRLYDPEGYAVGAGGGFNLFYDFLGFFPTSFYLDVATRVDRRASPQVLFGARQPF